MSVLIQQFATYVMRGRKEATMMALLFTLIPFMGWVGIVIMALVTLRKGAYEGLQILGWISLPSVVLAFFGYTEPLTFGIICGGVIVWLLAIVLRETSSWNLVIHLAVAIAILAVLVIHGVTANITEYWTSFITANYKTTLAKTLPQLSTQELEFLIKLMAQVATGIQASLLLLINLFNLVIARGAQALLYNPGGLRAELYEIKLGFTADAILLLDLLAIVAGILIAWDVLPLLLTAFFLAGISALHAIAAILKVGWSWILIFYGVLILFLPYIASFIIALAFVDTIVDFRKKLRNRQTS